MIEQLKAMPKYEAYKDSEVEWSGEIPMHWEYIPFKYLCYMKGRIGWQGLKQTEFTSNIEEPFLITGMNFKDGRIDWNDVYHIPYERYEQAPEIQLRNCDVLITKDGTIGKVLFVEKIPYPYKASLNSHLLVLRPIKNSYFPKFLYYHLQSLAFLGYVEVAKTGTTFFGITQEAIGKYTFLSPRMSEQIAIAAFLDRKTAQIDQAVSIKEKQIALLKERKQMLIQNALIRGLNPNAPMRDSGMEWIGEIPAHWEMIRVKNIFRLVIEPSEKNNNHELLSIYTDIGVKPRKELEEKGNKASTTDGYWLVNKGDFIVNKLLAWMGAIGLSEYEGVTSPAYDILRPIKPIEGYFYHYLFRTKACSSELKKYSRGIMEMRLRLYFDKFGAVEVPYPPKKEQTAIVAHIEIESAKIDQAINLQQQQIDKLKEYKATLINSAVTGKIKVPELVEGSSAEFTKAPVFEPVEGELVEDGVA